MNHMSEAYYMSDRHKAAIKRWTENNKERCQASNRASYHRRKLIDPKTFYAKKIFAERRRYAKSQGILFEISYEFVMSLPCETCPIRGTPIEWGTGSYNTASLDKINPTLGYVEGNVQWLSFRANTLKRDMNKEEAKMLSDWFETIE